MAEPSCYNNPRRAAEFSREKQKISPLVRDHRDCSKLERELSRGEAAALLKDPSADPDLTELAQAEVPDLQRRRESLQQAVLLAMFRPNHDSRNTVMEILSAHLRRRGHLFGRGFFRIIPSMPTARLYGPADYQQRERAWVFRSHFPDHGLRGLSSLNRERVRAGSAGRYRGNGRIHTSTVTGLVSARNRGGLFPDRSAGSRDHGDRASVTGRAGGQYRLRCSDPRISSTAIVRLCAT